MNKGLFVHIIVTFIYVGLLLFIFMGEPINIALRLLIAIFGIALNAFTYVCCALNDSYYERIKFRKSKL